MEIPRASERIFLDLVCVCACFENLSKISLKSRGEDVLENQGPETGAVFDLAKRTVLTVYF